MIRIAYCGRSPMPTGTSQFRASNLVHQPGYQQVDEAAIASRFAPHPDTEPAAIHAAQLADVRAAVRRPGWTVAGLVEQLTLPAWNVRRCLTELGYDPGPPPERVEPVPAGRKPRKKKGRPVGLLDERNLCVGCDTNPRPGGGGWRVCRACSDLLALMDRLHGGRSSTCPSCHRPGVVDPDNGGYAACDACRGRARRNNALSRAAQRAAGCCIANGCKSPPEPGRTRCAAHLEMNRLTQLERRRKARG